MFALLSTVKILLTVKLLETPKSFIVAELETSNPLTSSSLCIVTFPSEKLILELSFFQKEEVFHSFIVLFPNVILPTLKSSMFALLSTVKILFTVKLFFTIALLDISIPETSKLFITAFLFTDKSRVFT